MAETEKIGVVPERNWAFDLSPGLRLEATCEANSAILADFFEGYDRAFVLEDEKEPLAGFAECLALNHGAAYETLSARYGAFREIVLLVRDKATARRIGGANFISFPLVARGGAPCIGVNLNYIYVETSDRGKGRFKALLAGLADFIPRLFTTRLPALIFIEQNDPFRMSDEAYRLDTGYTGLDQFDRLAIWLHEGARIVDFDYAQPPLGPRQKPDDSLVYAVLSPPNLRLNACLLHDHLLRFFAISVLKGGDPDRTPSAKAQLDFLAENCAKNTPLDLLNMSSSLIERARRARSQATRRPASLRAFIRGEGRK